MSKAEHFEVQQQQLKNNYSFTEEKIFETAKHYKTSSTQFYKSRKHSWKFLSTFLL